MLDRDVRSPDMLITAIIEQYSTAEGNTVFGKRYNDWRNKR